MITQDLGIATAYGYAKSKGYTGTEAEFAELMASYASTAQTAIEAADRAVEANTAAQSAKTDAQASKTAAQTAAQTATTKASEASQSASTATTKASEASQSASTASNAATSANTSAQTATTAATTATEKASEASESAATASTAKTDAETARDAAAQSASRAEQSAESIDPDEFDRKIYAAFATDTATGAIASFPDGADSIPMKDVLVHIEPVQEGSGDPSPDNVRPITGWTGVQVTRTGKNLCNQPIGRWLWTTVGQRFDNIDGTYCATEDRMPVKGGEQYVVSFTDSGQNSGVYFIWFNEDGFIKTDIKWSVPWTATAPQNATKVALTFLNNEKYTGEPKISNVQLEFGSTATDYALYTGQTYPITFPTEAGTVYGGILDVVAGKLTVDRAQIASYNGEALPSTWISDRDVYSEGATPTIGAQVCYKLASPITYQLTPQEIVSLLGTNNLWADCGDTEVEYRANTKLYIEKLTQPEEDDMIADSAISEGQFFMIGNSLYRALANIASGATITVGTNAQRVSLSDALNLVNA